MLNSEVVEELKGTCFFKENRAYGVVDGQFGSTGKGLAVGALAEVYGDRAINVTTSAGPNSGHTSYFGSEPHVLTQLPTFAVQKALRHPTRTVTATMNAGSVVVPSKLIEEVERYPNLKVLVHPAAAIVTEQAKEIEAELKKSIGSTGKGTGGALALKALRQNGAVAWQAREVLKHAQITVTAPNPNTADTMPSLIEVSQGFSLGINQGFFPYCTSRECTVLQGLSDAEIHPNNYGGCMMVVRTYPIRVGGNSGPGYPDQEEITWADLGVKPERTTVTNKERRVFTWSPLQYWAALEANRPEIVFVNFVNYLKNENEWRDFMYYNVYKPYEEVLNRDPELILMGFGPKNEDIRVYDGVPF